MATQVPYKDLATDVNQFMSHEAIAPFLQNMPNYANLVGKRGEITGDMLSGQLPKDVMQQIQQSGAERGVASGSPSSPNANAAMLRALGLNSLQMQGAGNQLLSQSIADTPVPQLWNPMSLYVPEKLGGAGLAAARAGSKLPQGGPNSAPMSFNPTPGGSPNFMNKPAIPRYQAPAAFSFGPGNGSNFFQDSTTGFNTAMPQSSYDNWWDTYGTDSQDTSGGYSFSGNQNQYDAPAGPYNYNQFQYDSPAGPSYQDNGGYDDAWAQDFASYDEAPQYDYSLYE